MWLFLAPTPKPELHPVDFYYTGDRAITSVSVVGDFKAHTIVMTKGKDGKWTVKTSLPPGVYKYSFLVEGNPAPTGSTVTADEKDEKEIVVTPNAYNAQPGISGDGLITKFGIKALPLEDTTSKAIGRTVILKFQTRHADVAHVGAIVRQDLHQKSYPLVVTSSNALYDFWQAKVVVTPNKPFEYEFLLNDEGSTLHFGQNGLQESSMSTKDFKANN